MLQWDEFYQELKSRDTKKNDPNPKKSPKKFGKKLQNPGICLGLGSFFGISRDFLKFNGFNPVSMTGTNFTFAFEGFLKAVMRYGA